MVTEFDRLSESEVELMFRAPILTCILIAGADGNVDRKEIQSAITFITKKQTKAQANLLEFYREAGEDFEDKFKIVLQSFPNSAEQRTPLVAEELSKLNDVLARLDKNFASAFYKSLREIAVKIANSSGGLFFLSRVGDEEAKYLSLTMIKDPAL